MADVGPRPLPIYDGDCDFCRRWIERWHALTKDRVAYEPYQKVASHYPHVPAERFQSSVQLIQPDGRIAEGAEAVFRTLAYVPGKAWMLAWYEKFPGARFASERFYRLVADHRIAFSKLTEWLWGNHLGPGTFALTRWFFLKGLALVYLIAFLSLGSQILGLVGSGGILPAQDFLRRVAERIGLERYYLLPTLCWINAGDAFLQSLCALGVFLAILLFLGMVPVACLAGLWVLYLSLAVISQDFLSVGRPPVGGGIPRHFHGSTRFLSEYAPKGRSTSVPSCMITGLPTVSSVNVLNHGGRESYGDYTVPLCL